MANLMTATQFESFFEKAITDQSFLDNVMADPWPTLRKEGIEVPNGTLARVLPEIPYATDVKELASVASGGGQISRAAKPRCGVCGVCGLCALCGEINAGSASAALWALFHLAAAAA